MRRFFTITAITVLIGAPNVSLSATTPAVCGATGLISTPTADTLNAGNFCMGVWTDSSHQQNTDVLLVPFSLTLGLGTFWEAYGTFPNLLFNGDESLSDKGFAALGMKFRFLGSRSSAFKLAADVQAQNTINDFNPALDGLTNYQYRLIGSFKKGRFGLHLGGGLLENENPADASEAYRSQDIYFGGIEVFPSNRLRLIAEIENYTPKIAGEEGRREASMGVQYYVSPHLTLNASLGYGLSDGAPDWRAVVGLSSCQGIGTYQIPVKRDVPDVPEVTEEAEPAKVSKFKALTPLVPMVKAAAPKPVSSLEVVENVEADPVVVQPSSRLHIPGTELTKAKAVSPVAPASAEAIASPEVIVSVPTVTSLYKKFRFPDFAFSYDLSDLSDEGKKELAKVAEWLRNDERWFVMQVVGHTDSVGSSAYNEKLSLGRAIQVASYLVLNEGIDPARLFVQGAGESDPIAGNGDPEGRKQNRRVELLILVPEGESPLVTPRKSFRSQDAKPKITIAAEDIPERKPVSSRRTDAAESIAVPASTPVPPHVPAIKAEVILPDETTAVASVEAGDTGSRPESKMVRVFNFKAAGFNYDDKALPAELLAELSAAAAWLKENLGTWSSIRVLGHTDSIGAAGYNKTLSRQRAQSVADVLSKTHGLPVTLMEVSGVGEGKPVADNRTPIGRELNRRVQIEVWTDASHQEPRLSEPPSVPRVPEERPRPSIEFVRVEPAVEDGKLLLQKQPQGEAPKVSSKGQTYRILKTTSVTDDSVLLDKFQTRTGSFPYNESRFAESGEIYVNEIIEALRHEKEGVSVLVVGHSDTIGPQGYNRSLSLKRAREVADKILESGVISPEQISIQGAGEYRPLTSNLRPEGRSMNRRVEVFLLRAEEKEGR